MILIFNCFSRAFLKGKAPFEEAYEQSPTPKITPLLSKPRGLLWTVPPSYCQPYFLDRLLKMQYLLQVIHKQVRDPHCHQILHVTSYFSPLVVYHLESLHWHSTIFCNFLSLLQVYYYILLGSFINVASHSRMTKRDDHLLMCHLILQ